MHNNLIRDLDLFRILEAIFNARAFKFDTNVVVSVTFDIHYGFCYIYGQRSFDLEREGSDMNQQYG